MADKGKSSYKFSNEYRGCALIIVNKNFWEYDGNEKTEIPELKRKGSSVDCKKMKAMFEALDFKVKVFKDLTAEKMKKKIYKASQDEKYNNKSDCFALVISSHGEELKEKKAPHVPKIAEVWRHSVLGSDNLPMYIDEMMNMFKDDEAKTLAGKPKLFFIQACRSRHGHGSKVFDYGVKISVTCDSKLQNTQPSDAGDHADGDLMKLIGDAGNFVDVNANWKDPDEDEWTGELETDSSDDESSDDTREPLSDAKGDPDSGYMPPSPDKELPNLIQSLQVGQLPEPTLPPSQDTQKPGLPPQVEQITNEDLSDAKGGPDSGKMPPSPGGEPNTPVLQSQVTKAAGKPEVKGSQETGAISSSPEDKPDIKHSADTGVMPPSPFDIVPINCPNDCILVYPVMSGCVAFRRADLGSRLLHCMHKKENFQKLVGGCDFLQYITCVAGDMAKIEIAFEPDSSLYTPQQVKELKDNMPFKVATSVVHRLQGRVFFQPKVPRSFMSAIRKKLFNV